jgi:hypothetical protein
MRLVAIFAGLVAGMAAQPSAFRNLRAEYVGSTRCLPCHKTIYDKFVKTAMGRSVTRPAVDLLAGPVRVSNITFQREFQVVREGGELFQTESQARLFDVKYKLEYAIGSGENGISFVVRRGNYLFQAPLSYYAGSKRWDLSPGYEESGEGFNRPIYEYCIVCHSGRPKPVPRRDGLFEDPPFAELAIGCENCHGPGALHVDERSRGAAVTMPDTSIVNPHRLPARQAEDICMQCHQGGDARVLLPGREYSDFRPGSRLIETVAIFSLPAADKDADLLEHHSSMQLSRCFRESNGALGCVTCHDPHQEPADPPAYFRSKCMTCHSRRGCKLNLAARRATKPSDDCIACHMPKRTVARISHSALTNHRIPSRPGEALPVPLSRLAVVNGREAELPLATRLAAYGELAGKSPEMQSKYDELLDEAARANSQDPTVFIALGHKTLASSPASAAALLAKAEEKGATGPLLFLDLGEALSLAGKGEESVAALERGESLFPWSPALRKRLVLGYIRVKAYAKARSAMERYVVDFPEDSLMRRLLKEAPQ